jgi:2-polyprenyl-6-methoxyphenol hydroxylase-like FAD-dependent oxidoreductase
MRALDVGIIGCGTAGGAAAVFLARRGHNVTVYERVPQPTAVGAGITLQPTGLHVLGELGLYDEVTSLGAPIDRLLCQTRAGSAIVDLRYATVTPPGRMLFGLGLHRGVLFEALYAAARAEPRVTVRTGVEIVDVARAEARAASRWSWLVDRDRTLHGPHELVVVADGARSALRDHTSRMKRVERYPWGALWFVGRHEPEPAAARTLRQVVCGNHSFLGMLPTGRETSGLGSPLVSLFWSIRGDRLDAWRSRGLGAWKEDVLGLAPESEPILAQIHDPEQVLYAGYHDVVMHRFHTRNVVYLGDAAHATSPQLGQGTNLALWDAMELAACLDEESIDLARALAAYTRRREGHLGFYQRVTRLLTPFFQGDDGRLGALRDFAMPLLARIPLFEKVMTLTMLGVVDGFTGRTLRINYGTSSMS